MFCQWELDLSWLDFDHRFRMLMMLVLFVEVWSLFSNFLMIGWFLIASSVFLRLCELGWLMFMGNIFIYLMRIGLIEVFYLSGVSLIGHETFNLLSFLFWREVICIGILIFSHFAKYQRYNINDSKSNWSKCIESKILLWWISELFIK